MSWEKADIRFKIAPNRKGVSGVRSQTPTRCARLRHFAGRETLQRAPYPLYGNIQDTGSSP